jgi:DNA-binding FrmR family transcriptional regulator
MQLNFYTQISAVRNAVNRLARRGAMEIISLKFAQCRNLKQVMLQVCAENNYIILH